MKKIGFVDLYISEWHANKYPNWIQELNAERGTDFEVAYAYAEQEISPVDGRSTAEWCDAFGVKACATIEELCERSDYILILAPTNPEKHLPYAKAVLPFGKPTYIDKSFAPNLAETEEIMALAARYHTPFFSTSALRYATELGEVPAVQDLIVNGGGRSLDEYVIHMAEMAVMLLCDKVSEVQVDCLGAQRLIQLKTQSGKQAALVFSPKLPYLVAGETPSGEGFAKSIRSDFFKGLLADILRFYEEKTVSFDLAQLREVMRVRELILKAEREALSK